MRPLQPPSSMYCSIWSATSDGVPTATGAPIDTLMRRALGQRSPKELTNKCPTDGGQLLIPVSGPPGAAITQKGHIKMNTTHSPESTRTLGSLKKLAAPVALAGAFGLAAMGLGAGTANANSPDINCPTGVVAGHPSTATLANWAEGGLLTAWLDTTQTVSNQGEVFQAHVDKTLAAPTTKYFYLPVPALPAGHHYLNASEELFDPGNTVLEANCQFDVK